MNYFEPLDSEWKRISILGLLRIKIPEQGVWFFRDFDEPLTKGFGCGAGRDHNDPDSDEVLGIVVADVSDDPTEPDVSGVITDYVSALDEHLRLETFKELREQDTPLVEWQASKLVRTRVGNCLETRYVWFDRGGNRTTIIRRFSLNGRKFAAMGYYVTDLKDFLEHNIMSALDSIEMIRLPAVALNIMTSSGNHYDLSPAELQWLADCGDFGPEALLCIRLSLVHALGDTDWIGDVLEEQAVYHASMTEEQYAGKTEILEYFTFLLEEAGNPESYQSLLVEPARMPDGTPCGLVVMRRGYWERGLGSPRWWIAFSCADDGKITDLYGRYEPSVLLLERSGLFPGMTSGELEQRKNFVPEPLRRDEPMSMLLAGFAHSNDLKAAEVCVSKVLSGFPGSTLVIFDKISPDDPHLKFDLFKREINSLPHLTIMKNGEVEFGFSGPFDDESLELELSNRFLPEIRSAIAPAHLCKKCISRYRWLRHNPDSTYMLGFDPIAALVWHDEHPDGKPEAVGHRQQCKDWMHNLMEARNYLWVHGEVAEAHKALWEEAQLLLPEWPGFKRLKLNDDEMESYQDCISERTDIFAMVAEKYNAEFSYRCTGVGFVRKGFVCHPEKETE
ncbi:MAG: hypothetical protein ACOYL3_17435 [Desulfuromonadaceae bacterium]